MPLTSTQFAAGLRELADIYEAHPEAAAPRTLWVFLPYETTPDAARATIKALSDGGRVDKVAPYSETSTTYTVRRLLPSGLTVDLHTERSTVCRRVSRMQMVDTWECPESILATEGNHADHG